jgi:hypothetical protein
MYGKLATSNDTIVVKIQHIGDEILVTAEKDGVSKILVTITKPLYDEFRVMLGNDVKLVEVKAEVQG